METNLRQYFEENEGTGVLATTGADGQANLALYARPHVLDDGTLALIMHNRLTLKNLRENPRAAYLFMEQGTGYQGCRLYMTKVGEDTDAERIRKLKRRCPTTDSDPENTELFLVTFQLDQMLPLVGSAP